MKFDSAVEEQDRLLQELNGYLRSGGFRRPGDPETHHPQGPVSFSPVAIGIRRASGGGYGLVVRAKRRRHLGIAPLAPHLGRPEVEARKVGWITTLGGWGWKKNPQQLTWGQRRCRPLCPGASVGNHRNAAGTISCWVKRPGADKPFGILSAGHVLVYRNDPRPDDYIIQPGKTDQGRCPDHTVGVLDCRTAVDRYLLNYADCAAARLLPEELERHLGDKTFDPTLLPGVGPIRGVWSGRDEDLLEQEVLKVGRTTGVRRGRISAVRVGPATIRYNRLWDAEFTGLIEVDGLRGPFAAAGDSGALVVTRDGWAVGVVFGGSVQGGAGGYPLTNVLPLSVALKRLGVEVVCAP
jgi:hypothetical protein